MVDPLILQRHLDGPYAEIRQRVRAGMETPEFALVHGLAREEYRAKVMQWAKQLADSGETGLGFPVEYGGQGLVGGSIAAFETLGHGDLSLLVKLGVQFGLFGGAVLHLGTERHHERYLSDIAHFELPGCFAMTETGHGSNVQALGTTATYDAATDEFVIHTPDFESRKDYIGNAARDGRAAAVFAQLIVGGESQGVHALLVPIRDADGTPCPGVTLEDCGEKLGLNGVDNGRISFDQVRVPRDALLDRYGTVTVDGVYRSDIDNPNRRFFTMIGTLIQGRVSVCGASISVAKSALAIAIRHALVRRQFGPPDSEQEAVLLDYRVHQRRLLPALATTYALHFAQQTLITDVHRLFTEPDFPEKERRELETRAAGIKALATWHASATVQECREACGGAGYMAANRFAALKADSDVFTTFEGDNTVLMQLVAKNLLTDYRDQFGELDPLGVAGFFAAQVVNAVVERTAAREIFGRITDELRGSRDEGDVLDREVQLELFRWREEHVIDGLARRLKRGIDKGAEPFAVLIDCQDHLLIAARAHVDRIVLEAFAEAVERCEGEAERAVLDRLCSLHALWTIENDRGWFQEHGRLSSTRAKTVLKTVNRLCADLRPDAAALVDAFAIPQAVLAAGIGRA